MKQKYNVGDRVIIDEGNIEWMCPVSGKTGVIIKCEDVGIYKYLVSVEGHHIWSKVKCLAPLDKKIVITTDGKVTTAKLYEDGKTVKTATAKCSPEDTFDFGVGAKLALERLTAPEKPKEEPPKYYNGKVVCVKTDADFTVGKVYEIVDGVLYDDRGLKRPEPGNPNRRIESMDDGWINSCVYKFIPLVEDKDPDRPLTNEELMKMDGQKVWLSSIYDGKENFTDRFCGWYKVDVEREVLDACDMDEHYRFKSNGSYNGFRAYLRPQKQK